jgi:hypothetical protein
MVSYYVVYQLISEPPGRFRNCPNDDEKNRRKFFNLGRLQFAPPKCRAKTAPCGTEMADCGRLDEQVAAKNNPEAGHACCPFRLIDSQPVSESVIVGVKSSVCV